MKNAKNKNLHKKSILQTWLNPQSIKSHKNQSKSSKRSIFARYANDIPRTSFKLLQPIHLRHQKFQSISCSAPHPLARGLFVNKIFSFKTKQITQWKLESQWSFESEKAMFDNKLQKALRCSIKNSFKRPSPQISLRVSSHGWR